MAGVGEMLKAERTGGKERAKKGWQRSKPKKKCATDRGPRSEREEEEDVRTYVP